jgi:hypothetical protein
MRTRVAASAVVLLLAGAAAMLVAADSNIGTWNLNVAKSKFSPGPAYKSSTVTIEPWGSDGIKVTVHLVPAEGAANHIEYSAKYDGKEVPQKGNPNADTVSVKRINANTIESTNKKSGQTVMVVRSTVSADGKTRTSVQKGKNDRGQEVNNTLVFEKAK